MLDTKEIEMLVVLRMNRGFMKFMRENYSHLITEQHFGRTVVSPSEEQDDRQSNFVFPLSSHGDSHRRPGPPPPELSRESQ